MTALSVEPATRRNRIGSSLVAMARDRATTPPRAIARKARSVRRRRATLFSRFYSKHLGQHLPHAGYEVSRDDMAHTNLVS